MILYLISEFNSMFFTDNYLIRKRTARQLNNRGFPLIILNLPAYTIVAAVGFRNASSFLNFSANLVEQWNRDSQSLRQFPALLRCQRFLHMLSKTFLKGSFHI